MSTRPLNLLTANNVQLRAVGIARLVGGQDVNYLGHFLRLAEPVHGNLLINQLPIRQTSNATLLRPLHHG